MVSISWSRETGFDDLTSYGDGVILLEVQTSAN
jgi:hypothetical protein